jgi:superfamily II DNA helicase RecQ
MIKRPSESGVRPSIESIERQIATASTVVNYCNNVTECRRVQVLKHFAETFDKKKCGEVADTTCDNCSSEDPVAMRDVTMEAKNAYSLARDFQARGIKITPTGFREVLKGSSSGKKHQSQPQFGSASDLSQELIDQMIHKLCEKGLLRIEQEKNQVTDYHADYVYVRLFESF